MNPVQFDCVERVNVGDADKRYGWQNPYAEVPKRLKGAVLKTASTGDRGVGSNPTFRANACNKHFNDLTLFIPPKLFTMPCGTVIWHKK